MRTLVIWNPSAGSSLQQTGWRKQLASEHPIELYETNHRHEALALSRRTTAGLVIAAGGDGTIHTVVEGLAQNPNHPILGILPLGTANNLCRTLGIPRHLAGAWKAIETGEVRRIDLARYRSGSQSSLYANVASGGNSDRVIDQLSADVKQTWGPWCYLRGALSVMTDLRGYDVSVQWDDEPTVQYDIWNIIVANGRHAAAGLPVAPRASVEDGRLDVILILNGSPLDTAALATEFFLGDYLNDERTVFRKAKRVRVDAQPALRFLVDGELKTGNPVEFSVQPKAQAVIVGPDYPKSNDC